MKTHANPKILRWARENTHYTIPHIAKELKKDESVIISWENGSDSPSYTLLEKLAYQYYNLPLAVFYFPDPPNIENPKTKMRRLPEYELERLSPDTYNMINLGMGYQQSLIDLLGQNNKENAIFKIIKNKLNTDILSLANLVRQYLNINIEQQINFKTNDNAFKAWRYEIEKAGIFTFKNSFKDKFISGFSLFHEEYPIIFINNSNSHTRQIFTLIHELAHILFGINGISDIDDSYLSMMSSEEKQIEINCNRFAAEFLIPLRIINSELMNLTVINESTISDLSNKYKVSREVILRRLLDINILSADDYQNYVKKWTNDYLRFKKEKSGGSYYLNKLAYLGEGFTNIAFNNYKTGNISNIELAQHLNMNSKNIAKLETYLR
ncbi:MAG TPA: XRE family transcriptional regulator [Candidatus Glassbacteria bacterium]|nr:XRE family transcriptional regulator [Candidatus Glassbacteria bacterium]